MDITLYYLNDFSAAGASDPLETVSCIILLSIYPLTDSSEGCEKYLNVKISIGF